MKRLKQTYIANMAVVYYSLLWIWSATITSSQQAYRLSQHRSPGTNPPGYQYRQLQWHYSQLPLSEQGYHLRLKFSTIGLVWGPGHLLCNIPLYPQKRKSTLLLMSPYDKATNPIPTKDFCIKRTGCDPILGFLTIVDYFTNMLAMSHT